MSLKSQTQDPSLKSLLEDLCSGYLHPEKIHQPQLGLNPRTLDLKASMLPQDHKADKNSVLDNKKIYMSPKCNYFLIIGTFNESKEDDTNICDQSIQLCAEISNEK